jgi:hypothetical protein
MGVEDVGVGSLSAIVDADPLSSTLGAREDERAWFEVTCGGAAMPGEVGAGVAAGEVEWFVCVGFSSLAQATSHNVPTIRIQ